MATILYGDEERAVMVEKAPGGSKAFRKCCCCCLSCACAPVKTLWGFAGGLALVVFVGLVLAVVFLADARATAVTTAENAMAVVNGWVATASSYLTPAAKERMWRRAFVVGAPASPWSEGAALASGWIEFQADAIALNITASAAIAQVVLVQRPVSAAVGANVTRAPLGYSPSLAAPGILAAWLRGDLLYLALIAADGGLTQSILLPLN